MFRIHDCIGGIRLRGDLNNPDEIREAIDKLTTLGAGALDLANFIDINYVKPNKSKPMKTLQISESNARKLYKEASPEFRQTLEDTFGKDFFTSITSIEDCYDYEDCCKLLGKAPMDEQALRAAGATEFGIEAMRQETIIEAVNNGTKIDLFDTNQRKWQPWFHIDGGSSGFAFYDSRYSCSSARAGYASRLCLAHEKSSEFYGERFQKEIKKFMTV